MNYDKRIKISGIMLAIAYSLILICAFLDLFNYTSWKSRDISYITYGLEIFLTGLVCIMVCIIGIGICGFSKGITYVLSLCLFVGGCMILMMEWEHLQPLFSKELIIGVIILSIALPLIVIVLWWGFFKNNNDLIDCEVIEFKSLE